MTNDVQAMLKWRSAGYDALLERARRWRLSGEREQQEKAEQLLSGLRGHYPLALEIGLELVLALADLDGRQQDAQKVLDAVERQLRNPNEELLCRWGRLFKDEGDRLNCYLPEEVRPAAEADARRPNDQQADESYARALKKYDQAFEIRSGHYPGINKATLLLVRAALARAMGEAARSDAGVRDAKELATALLKRRAQKPWTDDQPDDKEVWHPATEAEAFLLLEEWKKAAELYCFIRAAPNQLVVMRRQIRRILAAWDLLGVTDRGPFMKAEDVLPIPVPAAGGAA